MLKFRTLSAVVILVAALTIGGIIGWTEEEQPRYGGTFVTAAPYEEIMGLDPLGVTIASASTTTLLYQIHEGLVKWNTTTLEIEPAIAERWEVSKDGKTYTFYLREGAKFHNGR
jgi:peptide/nickel transport system substrate-binding protein